MSLVRPIARKLRRSMLYVPANNEKMVQKSWISPADSVIYDLEDAVPAQQKATSRSLLANFLNTRPRGSPRDVVVRINSVGSGFEEEDFAAILPISGIGAIALPKADNVQILQRLIHAINRFAQPDRRSDGKNPLKIVALIESAQAMVNIRDICQQGGPHLEGLLFAAEDYCADMGIRRTPEKSELLYPRAKLATTAKAYGLQAIDMVCTDFKNSESLQAESVVAVGLGYDGKQVIHPNQIGTVNDAFLPDKQAIATAMRIVDAVRSREGDGGAFSLDGQMIDAPVYKQALELLQLCKSAGVITSGSQAE